MGALSSCALTKNGGVSCWGANDSGQLGRGKPDNDSDAPAVIAGLSGAVSVGIRRHFGCALLGNGTVQCWGQNAGGWLGDGTTNNRFTPANVLVSAGQPLLGAKALSVGHNHSCVVNSAGNVLCWGSNLAGQLGNNDRAASAYAVPALLPVSGFVDVSVGRDHTCALRSNGDVYCWGADQLDQLGDGGEKGASLVPVRTQISGAKAVSAGADHTCALLANGTVQCWGSNSHGEAGAADANGNPDYTCGQKSPCAAVPGVSGVKAISAGDNYTCALTASGQIWCWGRNQQGQSGDTNPAHAAVPRLVGSFNAVALSAGAATTCVATANGQILCWGANPMNVAGGGMVRQIAAAGPTSVLGYTAAGAAPLDSAGMYASCALTNTGGVRCWGLNTNGELGDGTSTSRATPAFTSNLAMYGTEVVSGADFSCALESDGSAQCWGYSSSGAIGNGSTAAQHYPAIVSGSLGNNGVALSAGYDFVLALEADGTVLGWGNNAYGQLGDGTTSSRTSPVAVAGLGGVTAVAAGAYHACALKSDGTVVCWGYNGYGELGNGSFTTSSSPLATQPLQSKAIALSAGWYHTCALLDTGAVQCWGYNYYGELGNGGTSTAASPTRTGDACAHSVCTANAGPLASGCDNVATQVCASDPYCCNTQWDAICVSEVATLAQGDCSQNVNGAVALQAGPYSTCAVNYDGALSCWGFNSYGQSGDGSTANRSWPFQSVALGNVAGVSAGIYGTCAARADGSEWCWGYNGYGEVGDGTTTQRNTPVTLTVFP